MNTSLDLTRRHFLGQMTTGLTGVALSRLLAGELSAATKQPHFAPKAKQVLQIFCPGAASHMDLWDYKPALEKFDGTPMPGAEREVTFQGKNGNLMKSPWPFAPAGRGGKMISSMLPHMARHVDDIAFIHSMTSRTNTHGPGCVNMNTCFTREGFPAAGSWVSYALGSMNQEGTSGRDHNPDAFTTWMMGAGVKGGVSHGATDDFGRRSVTDVATVYDFHATVLHLLGLDHEKLTYYHNGANRRLTDVHGHVLQNVLA